MIFEEDQVTTNEGGYVPEGMYRIRVLNTKFDTRASQKDKAPMTTLDFEIIEPESAVVNGKDVIVAGRKGKIFLVHDVTHGGWSSQEQVQEFCEKLGIDLKDPNTGKRRYDATKHAEYFKGLEFDIPLSSKEQVKVYAAGENKGKPILDANEKPISMGYQLQANPSSVPEDPRVSRNEIIAAQPY